MKENFKLRAGQNSDGNLHPTYATTSVSFFNPRKLANQSLASTGEQFRQVSSSVETIHPFSSQETMLQSNFNPYGTRVPSRMKPNDPFSSTPMLTKQLTHNN